MKLIRKFYIILFCALLTMETVLPVQGAASEVNYVGQAENFIFSPGTKDAPTNLFLNFQNVIPGDKLTQQIVVKNKEKKDVTIYLRSLGAQEGSEAFLSQLTLAVNIEGSSEKYAAPANESGKLSDWVSLGTLKPGAKVTLNVTLQVPVTMGNEFQEQAGYLTWEFKVEELADGGLAVDPTPETTPEVTEEPKETPPAKPESKPDEKPQTGEESPRTGDSSKSMMYISMMMGTAMALLYLRKKYNMEESLKDD